MTFGSGGSASIGACCTLPPLTEDGIIATPTTAPGSLVPSPHFDIGEDALYGGSPGNRVGIIHRGNGGEQIQFTFAGGNFDLLSVDIAGWDIQSQPSLSGTFAASSGATLDVSSTDIPALLSIDFSALTGWANISFFTFTVPVGVGACALDGSNCPGVGFDNIVMTAPGTVPIPAALPLFVSGLAGLGLLARRRKTVGKAA